MNTQDNKRGQCGILKAGALLLLMSVTLTTAKAQQTFNMDNNTSCAYSVKVWYSATPCPGKAAVLGATLTLNANSSVTYTTPSGVVAVVRVYQGTPQRSVWVCGGNWNPATVPNACGGFEIWIHGNGTTTNAIDYT